MGAGPGTPRGQEFFQFKFENVKKYLKEFKKLFGNQGYPPGERGSKVYAQ